MARGPIGVEFMKLVQSFTGLTDGAFAKACGKKHANMSKYLSGASIPGKRVLKSAVEHLYEWNIQPVMEVQPVPQNLNTLPTDKGIYVFYDSGGNVIYIGKATNFRTEVRQTLGRKIPVAIRVGPKLNKQQPKMSDLVARISLYQVVSPRLRHNLEALLLRIFANQTHNSNIGTFK